MRSAAHSCPVFEKGGVAPTLLPAGHCVLVGQGPPYMASVATRYHTMSIAFRPIAYLMIALCLLTACTAATHADTPAPQDPDQESPARPLACQTAADCAIKDVGNCCGYYPACVHKDQTVDPESVQARCKAEGKSSICGFPEITACACVEGQCVNSGTGAGGDGDPRKP
jgi:hypothetical protein